MKKIISGMLLFAILLGGTATWNEGGEVASYANTADGGTGTWNEGSGNAASHA